VGVFTVAAEEGERTIAGNDRTSDRKTAADGLHRVSLVF